MYVSLLFWLGLALPGYVLVRHLAGDVLKSGLLGTLSLSYLAILALLSPVSILCYVVGAPLAVLSGACWVVFVAALAELTRRGWWRDLGKLVLSGASVGLLIIAADAALGARTGASMGGDAQVHWARIRCLVDHGFNNADPYVSADYFFPTYHTNILHALYAACVQITSVDHFGVWFASLVWGKLMVASGMYYLAWCVFGRQWAAWLAAVYVVGAYGPVTFIVYPNKLAPLWVLPCAIGFAVQALQAGSTWTSCVRLGIASLLLGQIHGLYALFAAVLLAPVLGAVALHRIVRRRPDRWLLAACVLALAVGLPFPLVSKLTTQTSSSGGSSPSSATASDGTFVRFDNGWVMRNPRRGFGGRRWRYALLGLGIAAALATPRRRQAGCLVGVVAVTGFVLYTPPVCTIAVNALGAEWILGRFEIVLHLALAALLAPAGAFWLEPRVRLWWARGLITLAVLPLSMVCVGHSAPYDWPTYVRQALADREERQARVNGYQSVRAFLADHLPPGETVLADQDLGMSFVMFHDCHIVAAGSSSNGVKDLAQRREDLRVMLAENTPWTLRRSLLNKYGVRYFWPLSKSGVWAAPHALRRWPLGPGGLIELNTN